MALKRRSIIRSACIFVGKGLTRLRATRAWPLRGALGLALLAVAATSAAAQENPRFGVWKLRSDAAPPALNIMTYEPWDDGGMKITVESTDGEGRTRTWSYATLFDGVFRDVEGQENATTAVEIVDDRTNRISNARDGRVYQVIINVLSDDGDRIDNEYRRTLDDGTERVTHAVYERVRK